MNSILTPEQMYKADSYAIENIGIPSEILMENAANKSSAIIKEVLSPGSKLLILCGTGNNGGDGLALARHLNNDYDVNVLIVGKKEKFSKDSKLNYEILKNLELNLSFYENDNSFLNSEYDCYVDCLLGIGGKGELREPINSILGYINERSGLKVAIDNPTGLDALTGIAQENAFKADLTITMYAPKTGLFLNDGKDTAGIVKAVDIGAPQSIIDEISTIQEIDELKSLPRKHNSIKFDYGRVLIIAGSKNMPGAAVLSANTAISAGAGLVHLASPTYSYQLQPEVIWEPIEGGNINSLNILEIIKSIDNFDSVLIGPGIGKDKETINAVNELLLMETSKPIIIDADALQVIDIENFNNNYSNTENIIITPHIGEFANILDMNREEVIKRLPNIVFETAEKLNLTILLKGPTSIISGFGENYFMTQGVPELATAGSGDVLSGIILANSAIMKEASMPYIASYSALQHAQAVKYMLESKNRSSIIASDIIEGLRCIK